MNILPNISLFWKHAGFLTVWWSEPSRIHGIHLLVQPSCWVWGFNEEPASIGPFRSFGLGPLFLLTWEY